MVPGVYPHGHVRRRRRAVGKWRAHTRIYGRPLVTNVHTHEYVTGRLQPWGAGMRFFGRPLGCGIHTLRLHKEDTCLGGRVGVSRGAGFGVFFPHTEYDHISEQVVGPQTDNRAGVSAVRAGIRAVRNTQELYVNSDSKWCADIFSDLQLYKRYGWMAKGKQPVRHHDIF